MTNAPGTTVTVHGNLVYRLDQVGERVGVIPATCRRGLHSLAVTGYRAYVPDDEILRVSCTACNTEAPPHWDQWWLRTTAPAPDRAELDDAPYRDLFPTCQ